MLFRSKEKSATSIAMDCVLRAEELRIAERELRDMFAIQGKLDMYKRMCQIRADIIDSRQREIKEENRAAQAKIKKKKTSSTQSKTSFFLFLPQLSFTCSLSAVSI